MSPEEPVIVGGLVETDAVEEFVGAAGVVVAAAVATAEYDQDDVVDEHRAWQGPYEEPYFADDASCEADAYHEGLADVQYVVESWEPGWDGDAVGDDVVASADGEAFGGAAVAASSAVAAILCGAQHEQLLDRPRQGLLERAGQHSTHAAQHACLCLCIGMASHGTRHSAAKHAAVKWLSPRQMQADTAGVGRASGGPAAEQLPFAA